MSDQGLAVDPGKILAVRLWPTPTTVTEVQRFHGMASFYRRFVSQFSSLIAPMTDTIREGRLNWAPAAANAFTIIKDNLMLGFDSCLTQFWSGL